MRICVVDFITFFMTITMHPLKSSNDMTAMSGSGRNSAAVLKLPDRYGECPN